MCQNCKIAVPGRHRLVVPAAQAGAHIVVCCGLNSITLSRDYSIPAAPSFISLLFDTYELSGSTIFFCGLMALYKSRMYAAPSPFTWTRFIRAHSLLLSAALPGPRRQSLVRLTWYRGLRVSYLLTNLVVWHECPSRRECRVNLVPIILSNPSTEGFEVARCSMLVRASETSRE